MEQTLQNASSILAFDVQYLPSKDATLILLLIAIPIYIALKQWYTPTIYDSFERVGNPAVLPKFLGKSANALVAEGYSKVTVPADKPFVVKWWARDYLILPPKYLPELRHIKAENASFLKNFSDAVNLQHSVGNLYESDRMGEILRKGMNIILPSLTPLIIKEIELAFEKEIGDCRDWKDFKATDLFITISHRVVSRVLAGDELCRSENFIYSSLKFGDSAFVTGLIIAQLPLGPFRPILGWLIAQYHRLFHLRKLLQQVEPIVAKRMAEAQCMGRIPRYDDSIEWALKLNNPPERDARTIALEMLHILEAAAGAPGALITEAVYQLLSQPRHLEPLLAEIEAARREYGLSNTAIQHLPALDSFLMETNRLYPVGGVTAARTVMRQPLVFHDGLTLPPGTRFGFACKTMQRDPRLFYDPLRFDPERLLQPQSHNTALKASGGDSGKCSAEAKSEEDRDSDIEGADDLGDRTRQMASMTSVTHLPWGYGVHACPGRFYSIRLAKLVFMLLLSAYEIEWAGKRECKQRDERPPSFEVEGQFLPNMRQKIRIRVKRGAKRIAG